MCQKKKKGGGGLARIEDSINASIQRLEDYIRKCRRRLITATTNNTDNTSVNKTKITRKQKWEEKNHIDISSDKKSQISHEKT